MNLEELKNNYGYKLLYNKLLSLELDLESAEIDMLQYPNKYTSDYIHKIKPLINDIKKIINQNIMEDNIIKINIVEVATKLAHEDTYDLLYELDYIKDEDDMYENSDNDKKYKDFTQRNFNINYGAWYSFLKENEVK